MSVSRTSRLLVRLYPSAWRARYGEELEALIVESSGGPRVPWRMRLDVARGGTCERLRAAGLLGDGRPGDAVRAGALLTLCAWALFVIAGIAVQKFSEHWQNVTPASLQALPSTAFTTLIVAAVLGSVLVAAGIATAIPSMSASLRAGAWPAVRGRILTAALLTCGVVAATAGLAARAHGLTGHQRNGGDAAYAIAFDAWALLVIGCLVSWTAAAVAAARRLHLPAAALRVETWIASLVTAAMAAMTIATAVWWAALADAAPWFLAAKPVGTSASPFVPELLAPCALMLVATLLATTGSRRAIRAMPALTDARST